MDTLDLISLIVTIIAVASFSVVFTFLFGSYAKSAIIAYSDGKYDVEIIEEYVQVGAEQQEKSRRTRESIKKVISSVLFCIVLFFLVIGIIDRINNNATMIGDKTLMVVASGSMSEKNENNLYYLDSNNLDDQIPTYSIILLQKVDSASDLKLYDTIAYVNDEGVNIIHRIIRFNSDGSFTTRGDSNDASDSYHPTVDDVIGKYTGKRIPLLGIFILFFQSYSGIATILAIIYCMVMFDNRTAAIADARSQRTHALIEALELEKYRGEGNKVTTEFAEKLYFDKFIYHFSEGGLVSKEVAEELLKDNPPSDESSNQ